MLSTDEKAPICKTLPDKPSDLIRVAIEDLEKCEVDPIYQIEMTVWHKPKRGNTDGTPRKCCVCFAGSVIAQSFQKNPGYPYQYDDSCFDSATQKKFLFLDYVRNDSLCDGLYRFGCEGPKARILPEEARDLGIRIPEYTSGSLAFKIACLKLADFLESKGL